MQPGCSAFGRTARSRSSGWAQVPGGWREWALIMGTVSRFGPAVAQLAHTWTSGLDLTELSHPMMRRLWEQTGETVALLIHRGHDRVCVAEMPSAQPLSFKRGVGHSESVILGASGRAILAFADDAVSFIESQVPKARKTEYLDELARIRLAGYAISRDELIPGAVAIAAPFFTAGHKVAGSLAVYGPSVRMDDAHVNRITQALIKSAHELSQKVGGAVA